VRIDINALSPSIQYKLIASTIVPRPIALVTTLSETGTVNAAPFSFFNVMGEDPPILVLGLQTHPDGTLKDTTINIMRDGQFVVHTVDEALAEPMNVCGIRFPRGVDEVRAAGLTVTSSELVKPPRIVEAPVSFECEKVAFLQISPGRQIAIGKVLMMHARDGLIDEESFRIDGNAYKPIGRLHALLYSRQNDRFVLTRPGYEEWLADPSSTRARDASD
jgi:flavin reductase (DIM6/NTAB) family NADH-FMN oxidoreductase RutF